MEHVDRLGREIEASWRAKDYAVREFPEIARRCLSAAGLHEQLTPEQIVRWGLSAPSLPGQADLRGEFGQPPITLFMGRGFHIDALFWLDGTTTIHQHAFYGAFQVLHGASFHNVYAFEREREIGDGVRIGQLRSVRMELLNAGLVQPIEAGEGYIHSVFHLHRPSVSLVARTFGGHGVQFDYFHPGLAVDGQRQDAGLVRATGLIEMLEKLDHPELESMLNEMFATADLHTIWRSLAAIRESDPGRLERLISGLGPRYGDDVAMAIRAAIAEARRGRFLIQRRRQIQDPDQRFFLALLRNAQSRADVLSVTRSYRSNQPASESIVSWVAALARISFKVQVAGAPWEPNVFGLPEPDQASLEALRLELDGGPARRDASVPMLRALAASPSFRALFG